MIETVGSRPASAVVDPDVPPCSVCELLPATAGGLSCRHRFCPECFARYVTGSVGELDTALRCCVCGGISELIQEIPTTARPLAAFGRSGGPRLRLPCGAALSTRGAYIVVEKSTKRVYALDGRGTLLNDFAYTYNSEPGRGVALTGSGLIAVPSSDACYDFVSYYTPGGASVGSAFLEALGRRADIRGVCCDALKDFLYVTDAANRCIRVISNADKAPANRITLDPIRYEVDPEPSGVALSPEGDLYVTDVANHCVKVYSTCGHFVRKLGCYGERPGQFDSPTGVAVMPDGHVVVADRGNQRVQHLDADGAFFRYVVRFRAGYDVYMAPDDVFVTPEGTIAVLMTSLQHTEVAGIRVYK